MEDETRQCLWCGTEFRAKDRDQQHCKKLHAKKARGARARERARLAIAGRCPTPLKRVFQSEEHARKWNIDFNTQHLYRCPCGALHATTTETGAFHARRG